MLYFTLHAHNDIRGTLTVRFDYQSKYSVQNRSGDSKRGLARKSTRKGDSSVQRTVTTAPSDEHTSALSRQVRPDLYFQERPPALKDLITEKQVENKQSVFITKLTEAIQTHSAKTP